MRTFYFLIICLLFSLSSALAQEKVVVKGYVKSADGEPLIGVNILEVDAENRFVSGTVTDFNGFYMLKINPAFRLKFAYVGFKEEFRKVDGQQDVNITMQEEATQLNVVEVRSERRTSTGIKLRDVPMAVKKVDLANLDPIGATSADEMLQGEISGVDIIAASGDPGAGMQIRIRGTSTILGNREPLIVVDGIPFETEIDEDFDFASADTREYGAMLSLAPEDIESIEVLKDAASAAMYGSKAANGVLKVITKRGRKAKPTLKYSYKTSFSYQPDPIPMLNGDEYVTLQQEMYFNDRGNINLGLHDVLTTQLGDENYYNYHQDTDWLDEITRTGVMKEHFVSLGGGGEKVRYRTSVSYHQNDGTTTSNSYERLTTKINLDYFISDRLKFITDISYARAYRDDAFYSNIRSIAYKKMPNEAIYEHDAEGNLTGEYFNGDWENPYQTFKYNDKDTPFYNPVAMANESSNQLINDRLRSKFTLQYYVLDDLFIRSTINFDLNNNRRNAMLSEAATNQGAWTSDSKNKATSSNSGTFTVGTFTDLFYTPEFAEEKHDLSVNLRWETYEKRATNFSAAAGNLPSDEITNPGADGSAPSVKSSTGEGRDLGGLLNVHYKFDDRYILSGGVRFDASSNFGEKTKWGAFPFGAVAWRIAQEGFLRDVEQIDEFKFRASYGVNGTPPSSGSRYLTYGSDDDRYVDGSGIRPSNVQLRNLSWERLTSWNAGFDFSAFQNRLRMTFEVYGKSSKDLLWQVKLPGSSGFDEEYKKYYMNAGEMTNSGVEFDFGVTPIKNKTWILDLKFNIARNLNKVQAVPDNIALEAGNMLKNGEYGRRVDIGRPIGGFYGYRYLGVFPDKESTYARDRDGNRIPDYTGSEDYLRMRMGGTTNYTFQEGDAIYEDINHDGVIDELDVVYLGSSNPDFTGGFSFRLSYKRKLTLSSRFVYRSGQMIVNRGRIDTENMSTRSNQSVATLRRWRKTGDETDIPRTIYNTGYNWLGSDRFVEEGSYLRCNSISLSYRLDKAMLKRLGMSDFKIYATVNRPFTITDYTGQDPEVGLGSGAFYFGEDKGYTPPSRSVVLGASVTF
ncbi:SusC/RagA family TonB-linked outer membrane protein (plasmid) [Fulvitalea axinellae]|uniref:SusC/RagA family TonB-linked outer membrane protein n=1 Tax=Fulvitalea axinellae TaxID=1182444 RepID=A0AAU9CQE3_9BACT|nr:SusC/RagA family TonB-linked outer membrane protein [Fulvitalea axinellae]